MIKDAIIITLLLILAVLALGTAEKPEAVMQPLVKADWLSCVNINPGPLIRRRGINLYPRRKDIS